MSAAPHHDPDSHAERGRCRSGVSMRYLLIDGTETPEDLREAIVTLRAKQRLACIASTRAEIGADIDELIDLLPRTAI